GDSGGDGEDTTTSGDGSSEPGSDVNVGMVYALGGLGDKSFNDMAHRGIQDAEEEFGLSFKNAEPSGQSDFETLQRQMATSSDPDYDLIATIGFAQTEALQENAEQYSDQQFMIVDSVVESDNVASYAFKEHQGSFQVGHMAGLMTTMDFSYDGKETTSETTDDAVVGFVGGKKNDLIKKFQAGYEAGVKYANEDVEIKSAYAGSWSDTAKGKEIALSMYENGADVVYHAAGGTGVGVFKAAREKGRFAIGVDADQSRSTEYEDVIVASMVKHVDTAVYRSAENVVDGDFKGGEINALGLQKDGVEAIVGTAYEDEIPDEVTSALEESQQAIVDGDISVPEDPENVDK
ncbi:MAG: BMP family lipoprotein, partial [Halanaeroarchaeum sp.]